MARTTRTVHLMLSMDVPDDDETTDNDVARTVSGTLDRERQRNHWPYGWEPGSVTAVQDAG